MIKQYALEQGALEIQYIEEFFGEFNRRKAASEIVERLQDREHLIHMIEAPLPDEPTPDRARSPTRSATRSGPTRTSRSWPIW